MLGGLTLIGSGEIAAGMAKVHRGLFKALAGPPRPVFLDTPAGFELGAEAVAARFVDYFAQRFDLPLALAGHRRADDDPRAQAAALQAVARSNYILAGPGSPTYAAQQWKASQVFRAVIDRWQAGAQLVFASSAAIAISRHVLPVYEIYKVGQELHWAEGLDLLGPFGYELAIVTHWDNAEGGTHDTRACFMGMERFGRLRGLLPERAVVLGVDEHTACTLDLEKRMGQVRGRGGVTILRGGEERRHESGASFPLSELSSAGRAVIAVSAPDSDRGSLVDPIARASAHIADGELAAGLEAAAGAAPPQVAALLHQAARAIENEPRGDETEAALLQLLVELRAGLRAAKQWALADQVRDRLAVLGYELRDTPEGTVWERHGDPREP